MEARTKSPGNPEVITAIQQLGKAIHAGVAIHDPDGLLIEFYASEETT